MMLLRSVCVNSTATVAKLPREASHLFLKCLLLRNQNAARPISTENSLDHVSRTTLEAHR